MTRFLRAPGDGPHDPVSVALVDVLHGDDDTREALLAARTRAAEAAARTDADGDRCAWLSLQASVALVDVALEPMVDLAGKRARDLAGCALEALRWPDLDDEAVREGAVERLHGALDDAIARAAQGPRR